MTLLKSLLRFITHVTKIAHFLLTRRNVTSGYLLRDSNLVENSNYAIYESSSLCNMHADKLDITLQISYITLKPI